MYKTDLKIISLSNPDPEFLIAHILILFLINLWHSLYLTSINRVYFSLTLSTYSLIFNTWIEILISIFYICSRRVIEM